MQTKSQDAERFSTWELHAACRTEDPDLFFPEPMRGRESPVLLARKIELAQEVCARCPVIGLCRQKARDVHAGFGIWGGEYLGDAKHAAVQRSTQLVRTRVSA